MNLKGLQTLEFSMLGFLAPAPFLAGRVTLERTHRVLNLLPHIHHEVNEPTSPAFDLIRGLANRCEDLCFQEYGRPDV